LALFAIPALILWPPLVRDLEVGLTAEVLPFCALLLALPLTLLAMPLAVTGELRRWIMRGAALTMLLALIGAEATASFNATRKRPDSLAYLVDSDSAKAWWISFDHTADPWTRQVLGNAPSRLDVSAWGLAPRANTVLANAAAAPTLAASPIQLISNDSVMGGRRIQLHIARIGSGQTTGIYTDAGTVVKEMSINGRSLRNGNDDRYSPSYHIGPDGAVLRYFGVPEEGIDLQFTINGALPPTLRVVNGAEGLPAGIASRPQENMSKPFVATDMTFSLWTVKL
jgi:hypothetical protein